MHSVHTGLWDPRRPSKHALTLPTPSSANLRYPHVITATPAKRITFFKSGDSQFGGVRMAIHKRSFKCFDTLLDDLSQKVPLPFGVRTITTPRGTHTIKHLEQLQDGGCYLCSDRRQAKPINMELANKRQGIWYHQNRRPHRPETPPGHSHLTFRPRRILLVKNSEPGMRRSIVLSKRSTRSLRAFLDEVSEVMEFHVRKLYTAEGRRIDSVQSLISCPGVLVCVGREAFSPMLINFIRKTSEEKLPGLYRKSPGLGPRTPGNGARSPATHRVRSPPHGAQSRASEYDEGQESKKNVNFGLETRKSIIHPRSDSSNRSTRFSLSSDKSSSQTRPAIMNDDIEKRVLVNKDGSLSVEMRVRFRLQNDETVQWSTQIKRSPSLTNECSPLSQAQPHYLQQGQSESCSDPDFISYGGVDNSSQPVNFALEESHCPCCYHREEHQFDLWENPAHSYKHPPVPPQHTSSHPVRHTHSASSSSSCNSRRVVRCRARLSRSPGGSGSDQSQLVQEEMCVTEQVERRVEVAQDGDTQVEVCKVSRCCSRTEVVAMDTNLRPVSRKSVEGELMIGEDDIRPLSAVSSTSHVLQSLKEDQDDEDEDEDELPPSASQCCCRNEPSPCPSHATHQDEKPTSTVPANSVHSAKCKNHEEGRESRTLSAVSTCHCGTATSHSAAGADKASCISNISQSRIPKSEEEMTADIEDEEINRTASGLSACSSQTSAVSSVCSHCGACKRNSNSRASKTSNRASPQAASPLPINKKGEDHDDTASDVSVESTQSNKTNLTNHGRQSAMSNNLEEEAPTDLSTTFNPDAAGKENERAPSTISVKSHRSNKSCKSGVNSITGVTADKEEERSLSAMSAQSNLSSKSSKSHKSKCKIEDFVHTSREEAEGENTSERAADSLSEKSGGLVEFNCSSGTTVTSPSDKTDVEKEEAYKRTPSSLSARSTGSATSGKAGSVLSHKSAQSNVSAKSGKSHRSSCSHCTRVVSPGGKPEDETIEDVTENGEGMGVEGDDRAASAMSAKSNLSAKSNKSHKSTKASETSPSRSESGGEIEEKPTSQMSGKLSVKSTKSSKTASPILKEDAEDGESKMIEVETQARPESKMSDKSASSAKSQFANAEDRSPSVASGKSHISAKSKRSNHSAGSPNPEDADVPEMNMEDENENQEQLESQTVASVELESSKSSGKYVGSDKSSSSRNLSSPNVVSIKTPEGADDEEDGVKERPLSAASEKSSIASVLSQKSNHKRKADISVIETAEAGENVDNSAPKNKSSEHFCGQTLSPKRAPSPRARSPKAPVASPRLSPSPAQQLLPTNGVGETRGPSALSVNSISSTRSGRSRCRGCGGATSALEKAKTEKEGEDVEDGKSDRASERALSMPSSSSKRRRNESGGTGEPLSRNSFGSVSLCLPEDQDASDSDSGKSSVSFHNTEENVKSNMTTATPDVSKSPDDSSTKEVGERTESTLSPKSNSHSRTSASSQNPPAVDIPTIEMPKGGEEGEEQNTERAPSAITVKSSKSHKSCSKCSVKSAAQMLEMKSKERSATTSPTNIGNAFETESVKSGSATNAGRMGTKNGRTSAAKSECAKSRSKSPASACVTNASAANTETENQDNSSPGSEAQEKKDITQEKEPSVSSKSPCCLRPESAASTHSGSKKASSQSQGIPDSTHKLKSNAGSDGGSVKISSSQRKETSTESLGRCHLHSPRPASKVEAGSESTLSHSLSAADLLKETMASARQHSQQSKSSKASGKPRSEKRSRNLKDREAAVDLTPACLPNASPNEVVSDWLRSIPADSSMLVLCSDVEEEKRSKEMEETPQEDMPKEEESVEDEKVDEDQKDGPQEVEKVDEAKCAPAEGEDSSSPASGGPLRTSSLSKNWHFSAAVMKVLLSSSLGRCRSMPEVSPVYGRRLSTSARGLLDCLAQLQLIEPAVSCNSHQQKDHKQQYDEIMSILQSLWLTEPRDIEAKDAKDGPPEQVTPPRSSSGVGMSSGSGGSGKDNGNQGREETPAKGTESLLEEEAVAKVSDEDEGNVKATEKETEEPEDASKTDTAEEPVKSDEQSPVPQSLDSPKATENPSLSDKSSTNDSSKTTNDNERETLEDSLSSTPPTAPRATLSKRLSQDPDPVWVLHLLKKIEKQFMSHYINAMAEFKVRWDLDDSLILDTMISELKDEVSRRIQSSVEREMRKIHSRAGRGGRSPRPPQLGNISKESTMTEKRRRMLKVMKNQSVKTAESLSDDDTTGEFSDQRSEDEYCPCDACMRKKMAARPLKRNPMAAEAPVMMEFDLLKILQLKKSPSPAPEKATRPAELESERMAGDEEGRNLEVVEEEEEEDETKEDLKADVVLEETIPEVDEEVEEEKDEARESGVNGAEDEEQEEGGTSGEEAEQEETSDNAEEEEEDVGECTCQSGGDEEESNRQTGGEEAEDTSNCTDDGGETGGGETGENEGETGSEGEDEESDKETVKETTAGEEEEESGDDNSAQNAAKGGDISVSAEAENEDDGDDGTGEGESHEEENGEESEEQEGKASEDDRASPKSQHATPAVCVTEGEEADAEDSDDTKHQSDTGAEELGSEEAGGTGEEAEKESREDGDEEGTGENAVQEFKPEEDSEGGTSGDKKKNGVFLHQFTKASVESQPGSMEDVVGDSPSKLADSIKVPKMADRASSGNKRSRSPGRVKPHSCNEE